MFAHDLGHDVVQLRDDELHHTFLVLQKLLNFIDGVEPLSLAFNILGIVFVVVGLLANHQLLLKGLFAVLAAHHCRAAAPAAT